MSLPIYRETQQVVFSTQSARFLVRDKFLYLKERGNVLVEFSVKTADNKFDDKKMTTLSPEDFYGIINLKGDIQLLKRFKTHTAVLSLQQKADHTRLSLELEEETGRVQRTVDLRSGELFMLQHYLQYALPYTLGWFALANAELAAQHVD